jgi:hypothetical protein
MIVIYLCYGHPGPGVSQIFADVLAPFWGHTRHCLWRDSLHRFRYNGVMLKKDAR